MTKIGKLHIIFAGIVAAGVVGTDAVAANDFKSVRLGGGATSEDAKDVLMRYDSIDGMLPHFNHPRDIDLILQKDGQGDQAFIICPLVEESEVLEARSH